MKKIFTYLLLFVFMASSCTTSKVQQTWRDQDVSIDLSKLNKVLLVAHMNTESSRRIVEDKLNFLLGSKGIKSYQYLKSTKEEDFLDQQLEKEGFDGAIVIRLIKTEEKEQYVPGQYPWYYNKFGSYYRNSRLRFYQPGYYTTETSYYLETNVYSFKRNKLVWSGITTTINPEKDSQLIDDVAMTVFEHMKKEGFVVGEFNK